MERHGTGDDRATGAPPRRAGRLIGGAAVILGALVPAVITGPTATAEPIGDVYGRADVTRAAEFIQENSGAVTAGAIAASTISAACGPLAVGCVALVNAANADYQLYAAAITNAARRNQCLFVFFGDNQADITGVPDVAGYSGTGCAESGRTDLTDEIVNEQQEGH